MDSETPKDECWCSKDDDGRCVACSERLSEVMFQLADSMLKAPNMVKALCQSCRKTTADWSAAKAIRELMAAHPEIRDVSTVTSFVNNFVASSGITKTPLLDAEIRRFSEQQKRREDSHE